MPAPGPAPVADRSQVRRANADTLEWREYDDVPNDSAPPLPPRSMVSSGGDVPSEGGLGYWPDATQRWYRAISRLPHTRAWNDAEWQFCFDVAEIHARFVEGWKGHNGSELRLREAMLGNTWDARRGLRIRYVEPKPAGEDDDVPADVARLDDYRNL